MTVEGLGLRAYVGSVSGLAYIWGCFNCIWSFLGFKVQGLGFGLIKGLVRALGFMLE